MRLAAVTDSLTTRFTSASDVVDEEVFRRVGATLESNAVAGSAEKRNKHGALLRGLLHCACCKCPMGHRYTSKGQRRYRYYVCNNALQNGWASCPAPSVPAGEIERFVIEEIRAIGRDSALVSATLAESRRLANEATKRLKAEGAALERQPRADEAEVRRLAASPAKNGELAHLVKCQERIATANSRLTQIKDESARLANGEISEAVAATALTEFDAIWAALKCSEQVKILNLLIERVEYDGSTGNMAITFQSTGLKALSAQFEHHEETAA
jgi:site-specific DNA recombinase